MAALVFDLGGTHLRSAIADDKASLLNIKKKRIKSFIHNYSPADIWNEIINEIVNYSSDAQSLITKESPIIISFPGPVEFPSRIINAPTVVGNNDAIPDLVEKVKHITGRQTYIINDVSAAAWYFSNKIDSNRFIVVTVSSGIGSKVFDRGKVKGVLDDVPFAGEIGHIVIDRKNDALLCDCGGKGHLGAISSGRGVERFARIEANRDRINFNKSVCAATFHGSPDNLTNEDHIVPAAKLGDLWTINVISQCSRPLATILLFLTAAFGLDKVVIIGGFALSLDEIYKCILQKEMADICDYALLSNKIDDLLVMGDADEEACLKGAAVYSLNI
jgi:glucokinase